MKLRPLGDRVVIKPTKAKEKMLGGIIVPESDIEKSYVGRIVALSDEAAKVLKLGDLVVYENYGCTKITCGGNNYVANKIEGIVCVLEEEDE